MPINTGIDENIIKPLAYFCIDTQTEPEVRDCCGTLFLAPMLPTGAGDPNVDYLIGSVEQAEELFGEGSIAADMANYYLLNNSGGELHIIGMEDTGGSASSTITFNGTATSSGTYTYTVGNTTYNVSVLVGDTPAEIAQMLSDEINADPDSLVTATVANGVITLEAKNGGVQGDCIPVCSQNFFGISAPEGVTSTVVPMSGGSGLYDLETALSVVDCCCYDFFGIPFKDGLSMSIMEQELQKRNSCEKLIGGRWYTSNQDNFTNQITFLDNVDYKYGSVITSCNEECFAPWQETAAFVGRAHVATCIDPAQSWYDLPLIGIPCTSENCGQSCFTDREQNLLALNGGTVTGCSPGGNRIICIAVSAADVNNDSYYKYPQYHYTTVRVTRELNQYVVENFSRARIVDTLVQGQDSTNTTSIPIIRTSLFLFATDVLANFIEAPVDVASFIQIERNLNNPSRIDGCITIDLINALRVFALKIRPRVER